MPWYRVAVAALFLWCLHAQAATQNQPMYPTMWVDTGQRIDLEFLYRPQVGREACERFLQTASLALSTACITCQISKKSCNTELTPAQEALAAGDPISQHTALSQIGVIVFHGDAQMASAACLHTARQSADLPPDQRVTCLPPGTARPSIGGSASAGVAWWLLASGEFLVAVLVALGVCYLILKYENLHSHMSHDQVDAGPQKFHAVPTARVGGVGVFLALCASAVADQIWMRGRSGADLLLFILICAIPTFSAGLWEDLTGRVKVLTRLSLAGVSGLFAIWLLDAVIVRLGIPIVDSWLLWGPLAIAFTTFCIAGVTNSINIIDGYNGLVAGFAIMASAALGAVAALVGDRLVLVASLSLAGAMLGFIVWNFPRGRIFLGDGGAYLVGFWLATLAVLVVKRNAGVSPWFPLLVLAYPIIETLFSIYRRRCIKRASPGHPDAMHLHQLIYSRAIRRGIGVRVPRDRLHRNNRVAPRVWVLSGIPMLLAIVFWKHTTILVIGFLACFAGYIYLYRRIIRYRTPELLISGAVKSGEISAQ